MPYKDPEKRQEYIKHYMRAYRRKTRKPEPEKVIPPADPEHVTALSRAVWRAVSTPEGRGRLLRVGGDHVTVVMNSKAAHFPAATVGLWA